jgi:hypothetical protein
MEEYGGKNEDERKEKYMEGPKKATKTSVMLTALRGRDLKPRPPEYEARP